MPYVLDFFLNDFPVSAELQQYQAEYGTETGFHP